MNIFFKEKGCPKCVTQTESNVFYLIRMTLNDDYFYKLGISYITDKNEPRRYSDYRVIGYTIEEIKRIYFESASA